MCYIHTTEYYSTLKRIKFELGVVALAFNPCTLEAEDRWVFVSLRPDRSIYISDSLSLK